MNDQQAPPFQAQRIICLALVGGLTMYTIVAAIVLQTNGGEGLSPGAFPEFDVVVLLGGSVCVVAAWTVRLLFERQAQRLDGEAVRMLQFLKRVVPIGALEFGGLVATTGWLLEGTTWPYLVVLGVLLAQAIALLPMRDPDAAADDERGDDDNPYRR